MPHISLVYTARFVADRLGVDEDVIDELAETMRPKDGCLSVIHSADENDPSIIAFTDRGIEMLEDLLAERATVCDL